MSSPARVSADPALQPGTPRRFDIELLRVVAVVGVVLFHFAPGTPLVPNGYLGVDVFFTISGFVITAQMLRSWERGRLTYAGFLARRVRRLLPSAVLVIVVTYAVVLLSRDVIAVDQQSLVAVAALLYASNLVFALQSVDYFATVDAPSPFLHYWSLSVEEQFYLVWPLVLIAVAYGARRRSGDFRRWLLAVALGGTVVSLALAAVSMDAYPDQTFFMPWARAHQLLIGAAAAVVVASVGGVAGRLAGLPGPVLVSLRVAAVAWLVAVQVLPFGDLASPGPVALLVSLPVAFIALSGTGTDLLSRIGGLWPLAWTARLSYVIYLWHWPVWLVVLDQFTDLGGREKVALALAATLVLSVITHLAVEQPLRDGRRLRALPPLRTAALGLGASVLAAVTVLGAAAFAPGRPWQEQVRPAIVALPDDKADAYERGCHVGGTQTQVTVCADGPAGAPVVMTLGDSHAVSWQPGFQALARQGKLRYLSVTKGACTVWDVPTRVVSAGGRHTSCEEWRRKAFDVVVREKPRVVVLHSSVPWWHLLDQAGKPVRDRRAALAAAVTATVTQLRRSGATVVAMPDTPTASADVQRCLATAVHPSACDFPTAVAQTARPVLLQAARRAGAVVVDPYLLVCPQATCQVVQDGTVVYRDAGHLTRTYVLRQVPWLRSWLEPLLAGPPHR